jgi:hypothetical protein
MPESQSTPSSLYRKFKNAEKIAAKNYAAEQGALNIESPESPEPQEIHEEFPCYTQSFLEEENDNAMDVGDVASSKAAQTPSLGDDVDVVDATNSNEAPTPSLEDVGKPEKKVRKRLGSYSVSSDYGYPTDTDSDSDSGCGSIKDLPDSSADGKVSDELISEDASPSLGDAKRKKDRKRRACCHKCDEYFRENSDSDSDDENSHSLPCKFEVVDEIERKKRELDEKMELDANDRYLSFSEKFGIEKKNSNLTIAEFYFNEIQKLSGIV